MSNNKITCEITNYGGIIRSLSVPDQSGNCADVVLGYEHVGEYETDSYYFGAIIGRYANRIAEGQFELNNALYQLAQNDGHNHRMAASAVSTVVWTPVAQSHNQLQTRIHRCRQGRKLSGPSYVQTTGALTDQDELRLITGQQASRHYCQFTNHAYFNLKGHNREIS